MIYVMQDNKIKIIARIY